MTQLTRPTDTRPLRVEIVHQDDASRIILRGEADIATVEELKDQLASVDHIGNPAVQVLLTDLDFADVATVRELALFAGRVKQAGGRVTTSGAKASVRKLARLMRIEDELALS